LASRVEAPRLSGLTGLGDSFTGPPHRARTARAPETQHKAQSRSGLHAVPFGLARDAVCAACCASWSSRAGTPRADACGAETVRETPCYGKTFRVRPSLHAQRLGASCMAQQCMGACARRAHNGTQVVSFCLCMSSVSLAVCAARWCAAPALCMRCCRCKVRRAHTRALSRATACTRQ
jgi:hypothetical protein